MHNYTFSMSRKSDSQWITFPFSFESTICMSADEVWQEMVRGYVNHTAGWMWPTQFSQPSIDAAPPRKGSRLVLTYQIPNPNNPSGPKKNATYEFDFVEWCDAERCYTYRATETHPFLRGGGTVRVIPIDSRSCRLQWQGEYKHIATDKRTEAQGDVFAHFLCTFFTSMAQNIKKKVGYPAAAA